MSETRKQYDYAFKAGAVRIVLETGQSVAQVARDLDVNERTLAGWVQAARGVLRVMPGGDGRLLPEVGTAVVASCRRMPRFGGCALRSRSSG